jgi:serine-type D-Ala-D-Ala carboxypeptidase/endopeptidase
VRGRKSSQKPGNPSDILRIRTVLPTAQSIPPNTPPHRIGTKFAYSNIGIVLLGHLISLRAGSNYEALLVSQICEPLRMNSAHIMLSPDLKVRLAM